MSNMDLIPDDYRKERRLQKALFYFCVANVIIVLLIVLGEALFSYLTWRENTDIARLEQQEQVLQNKKVKAAEYQQKRQVVEQKIATLNTLRGNDHVPVFLSAIDRAYTDGVWFDQLRFARAPIANTAGAAKMESQHVAEIVGHALNHSLLATFMRHLGGEASTADLHLINTGTSHFAAVQIVDFKLHVNVSEQSKRQSI